jgi:hypothetical protein
MCGKKYIIELYILFSFILVPFNIVDTNHLCSLIGKLNTLRAVLFIQANLQ